MVFSVESMFHLTHLIQWELFYTKNWLEMALSYGVLDIKNTSITTTEKKYINWNVTFHSLSNADDFKFDTPSH